MLANFCRRSAPLRSRGAWLSTGSSSSSARSWSQLVHAYQGKVSEGQLRRDPRQEAVVERLGRLSNVLAAYRPPEQLAQRAQQPVEGVAHATRAGGKPTPPTWGEVEVSSMASSDTHEQGQEEEEQQQQQQQQQQKQDQRPIPRWDTHLRPRTVRPATPRTSAEPPPQQQQQHHPPRHNRLPQQQPPMPPPAPGAALTPAAAGTLEQAHGQEQGQDEAAAAAATSTAVAAAAEAPGAPAAAAAAAAAAVAATATATAAAADRVRIPRGVYVYGEVGSGKSMLVDMFFDRCAIGKKRRVHFHQFMLEVHRRVHDAKQRDLAEHGRRQNIDLSEGGDFSGQRDPVRRVAREIAAEAWLLCFDEFQVTDVADALIMRTLFSELWQCGTVCVFTSNRPPSALYEGGINREYFEPWIDALSRQCAVVAVGTGADHRQGTAELPGQFHYPLTPRTAAALEAQLAELTDHRPLTVGATVPVMMGRTLAVPRSAVGVAAFSFGALCERNLSAADYRALCTHFHTLVLSGVPELSTAQHNEARRFITLVDELYEARVRLVATADADRDGLFTQIVTHVTGSVEQHGAPSATALSSLGTDRPGGPAAQSSPPPPPPSHPRDRAPLRPIAPEDLMPGQVDPASDDVGVLEGELAAVTELAFAFRRASSRLREMASEEYLQAHWEEHAERYRDHGTSILRYVGATHPDGGIAQ